MGHYIKIIIGSQTAMNKIASNWVNAKNVSLNYGFSAIPMTDELFDDINELVNRGTNTPHEEFNYLSISIEHMLKEVSFTEKIGFIETNYFGGAGAQSGIAYQKGEILDGPLTTKTIWDENKSNYVDSPKGEGAINQILYALGFQRRTDTDGFESIGLVKYRSNEAFLKTL